MATLVSRRRLFATAGVMSGGIVLAACGAVPAAAPPAEDEAPAAEEAAPAPAEPVTISFWAASVFATADHPASSIVERFNEQNPDITVEVQPIPVGLRAKEKFITAVAAGSPPEVFYLDRYLAGQFSAAGFLADLTPRVNATSVFEWEDFWPKLREDVTWKGKVYAVPLHCDGRALHWNKEHFIEIGLDPEEPVGTWDELESAASRLYKTSGEAVERIGFTPTWGNPPHFLQWYIWFWQLGGEYLTPDNRKPNFNNDAGLGAFKFMLGLLDLQGGLEGITAALGNTNPSQNDHFTVGRVSMMVHNGASTTRRYQNWGASVTWGVGGLPIPEGGLRTNYLGGWSIAMPQVGGHPDQAFRFVEHLMTKESQLTWADGLGLVPALESIARSDKYRSSAPHAIPVMDEIKVAKWVPVIPGNDEILTADRTAWVNASTGKVTPEEALAQKEVEVQAILDKWADSL